jgi:hypothetical protein
MLSDNNVQLLPSSEVNFESYQPEGGCFLRGLYPLVKQLLEDLQLDVHLI